MHLEFLTEEVKITRKKFLAVTLLFSNTLACFYLFYGFLIDKIFANVGDSLWFYVGSLLFYTTIVFSALVGCLISERVNRRKFLSLWLVFGVLSTASLAIFQGLDFSLLSCILIGISFGLGFPACVAFMNDSTSVEERGRVSGLVILITFAMLFATILITSTLNLGLLDLVIISVFLKTSSFFSLHIDAVERKMAKKKSWVTILTSNDFGLYLFPWLMFSIAYGLSLVVGAGIIIDPRFESAIAIGRVLQYISSGVFAFVAGITADRLGRKLPIIIGLVLLGASYAFLGLASSPISWIFFLVASGVAWGMLMVSLALTAFGDLAKDGSKERVFVLATIIPLMAHVSFSSLTGLLNLSAPANILSSILSFILFLSIIPVFLAKETLPANKIQSRAMRKYLERVRKRFQKEENENSNSP